MSGYSWLSGISIFCYLFLLLSFLTSQKKERVIISFIRLLIIMILWTGGSVGMRMMLWPSVNFWHHISLLGMMLLPFGYYQFLLNFLDEKPNVTQHILCISTVIVFLFNCITNFFIPLPEVIKTGTEVAFRYHYDWQIYILIVFVVLAVIPILSIVWRHCRGNRIAYQQLLPVIIGIGIIFIGNILATLTIFVGVPVDMLSGAVNVLFIFYALYKKKLFRMTILLTKTNFVILSMILGFVIFSDISMIFQRFLCNVVGMSYITSLLIVTGFLAGIILLMYVAINTVSSLLFTRVEKKRQARLARFKEDVTHVLCVEDILQNMTDMIREVVELNCLFVLIRGMDGNYYIEYASNPLDEKNFHFRADHPIVTFAKRYNGPILLQDLLRKTLFRSMWEDEKYLMKNLQIECLIPLRNENDLFGLILLSGKKNRPISESNSMEFLKKTSAIAVEALCSAYTYEKSIADAQKDDLTGLISHKFFYEILDYEFEKHKDTALSLCIINVDDFKMYNQLYGNQEGDLALQRIATILRSAIGETSHAARINGDEFALILPGYDSYSAKLLADNIATRIRNIKTSATIGKLSVSIGVCAAPYMASSAKELYRNADTTVYAAKRNGKNAVQVYSEDIYRRKQQETHKSGYTEHANTIYALTAAIDAKDHYTYQHSQNVAYYATKLANAAGIASDVVEIIRESALLHDIGKIGIREEILNKPDKLTPDEYETMKSHVENAVNIIRYLPSLDYAIPAVLSHHERYDGNGYPRQLSGDDIPITGRILCIADSFDAITANRNYKPAIPVPEAVKVLRAESGGQFDPILVDMFLDLIENGEIDIPSTQKNEEYEDMVVKPNDDSYKNKEFDL